MAAINGVATFSDLSLTKAGTYTLRATDGVLILATSTDITVSLPASHLAFVQQPVTTIAGQVIGPVLTVQVLDSSNHLVASDDSAVAIALVSANGATLNGATSVQVFHGMATFSDLSLTVAGSYTFTASDGALASTKSRLFTIAPAATTQLLFDQEPGAFAIAGTKIAPAMTVVLKDQFGNVQTNDHSRVTLSILSGPNGTALAGTVSVNASRGVAKFGNVSLRTTGTYTLQALDDARHERHIQQFQRDARRRQKAGIRSTAPG